MRSVAQVQELGLLQTRALPPYQAQGPAFLQAAAGVPSAVDTDAPSAADTGAPPTMTMFALLSYHADGGKDGNVVVLK